ncbi:small integral membrane protein 8 [Bradysia coprophila]|uniref:small integral membrane protein 8 n=1 Tax=Bradysia coprophila TaxID=38358 RepID=UPI00187DA6D7|nr:small integral membrane protein 8 [Bradysia coprophila]
MGDKQPEKPEHKYQPGEGIRSMRTTGVFRVVNYELYAKPNIVIMTLGLIGFGSVLAYIGYMRSKYESQGYYAALQEDGTEVFAKRRSKWE